MRAKLSVASGAGTAPRTSNLEAYSQYLIGKQLRSRNSEDGFRRAGEAFRRAIALDPSFAPAYADLSFCETILSRNNIEMLNARDDADRAIELAPTMVDGYLARAYARLNGLLDFEGARRDVDKALLLNPNATDVWRRHGHLLATFGRLSEAIASEKKALELDPLSGFAWDYLGTYLSANGQYEEARHAFRRELELVPDASETIQINLGTIDLLDMKPQQALLRFQATQDELTRNTGIAMAEHSLGHAETSERAVSDAVARFREKAPYRIAMMYAWLGDKEKAFASLDLAYAQREGLLAQIKFEPLLASLRKDSRFGELLHRLNLPEE